MTPGIGNRLEPKIENREWGQRRAQKIAQAAYATLANNCCCDSRIPNPGIQSSAPAKLPGHGADMDLFAGAHVLGNLDLDAG